MVVMWLPQGTQTPSPNPQISDRFKWKIGLGKQNRLQFYMQATITYYVVQIPQQFIQQMPNFIQYMFTQYNSSIHVSFITLCAACLPSYYNYYKLTGTYMYSVIWILNHCSKLSVKEQWKHYEPALLFWPSGRLRKCKKDQFGTM